MIKINLANKKQASYASSENSAALGGIGSLKGLIALAESKGLLEILPRLILPLVLCIAANYGFDYYIELKLEEYKIEIVNAESEKTKVLAELTKVHGYETQKAELEKTEKIINTKISTIERLIKGKGNTVKSMIDLSQAVPKDVWLTEVVASEKLINIRGNTTDIERVSDMMSKLGSSIYFKEVTLKSSSSDTAGLSALFELNARRE